MILFVDMDIALYIRVHFYYHDAHSLQCPNLGRAGGRLVVSWLTRPPLDIINVLHGMKYAQGFKPTEVYHFMKVADFVNICSIWDFYIFQSLPRHPHIQTNYDCLGHH